jgi:hypothetical protein
MLYLILRKMKYLIKMNRNTLRNLIIVIILFSGISL